MKKRSFDIKNLTEKIIENPLFNKLAYLKAKKDTTYKIKIELMKKLCARLKTKGVQYTPLSDTETLTYEQVWFEIFSASKIGKKGITAFFDNKNFEFIFDENAEKEFDRANKKETTIVLAQSEIAVRAVNASKLKAADISDFAGIVVTAHDFSWTYYSTSDGRRAFYIPAKNKL